MSRILIVDDNPVVSHMMREQLTHAGYEVMVAENANQGYASAIDFQPDLILLDVQLPDVVGHDLVRIIKNRDDLRTIPIIMVTATAFRAEDKVKSFQMGADDYLVRPFEMPVLLDRIKIHLRPSSPKIDQVLVSKLEQIGDPSLLLGELGQTFGQRMAIATSGQPTDTAIIALAIQGGVKTPRVYSTDTYRLFPETYAYYKTLEEFFKITIERFVPPEKELTRMVEQHGEFLFFDSKDKQEYCCHIRKVLPNLKALDSLDVWVTGLRRDQSASRAHLPRLEIIEHQSSEGAKRPLLKVNPLATWTEKQVAGYLKDHAIPNHPLFEKKLPGGWYYESLGCILCTTPIAPHEPRRAGRWRWLNALDDKKECGLHLPDQPNP